MRKNICEFCGDIVIWNGSGEHSKPFNPDLTKHECPCFGYPIEKLSTKALVTELAKREGVMEYAIDPYIKYVVEDETGIYTSETGPARILVVID